MMLLCMDVGNTNIVLGVFEDEKLTHSFRIESNPMETPDEYGIKIIEMLRFFNVEYQKISGVIIASVVPGLDGGFERTFDKFFGIKPIFVSPGTKSGIKIKIDNPKQLGADILVGCMAAHQKYGSPCIVVDMGTAITFAGLTADKEILGVTILPGIKTSYSNLISKTARLESARMEVPLKVLGRDTVASIQSGMVFGTASMIDGMIRKIKKEMGVEKIITVLTGGESRMVREYLEEPTFYDENLLLDGLRIIYQKNL